MSRGQSQCQESREERNEQRRLRRKVSEEGGKPEGGGVRKAKGRMGIKEKQVINCVKCS